MKISRFIQLVPSLVEGDAISDYARLVRKICAGRFREAIILAARRTGRPGPHEYPISDLGAPGPESLILYHHSTGDETAEAFLSLRGCLRAVYYHNITPPDLLLEAPDMAARSHRGLLQLDRLTADVGAWLAASEFSAQDLRCRGARQVQVVPYGISQDRARLLAAAAVRRGSAVPQNILFVGRIVPHKAVDDVVRVFALVQQATGGKCRLTIVGGAGEASNYSARVQAYAKSVAGDFVDFLGLQTGQDLADAFARAGVYLSMSRHEGFGLPLCEAMFAGVPVVAADHGAVRETVGDGGLVIADADLAVVAEATQAMIFDPVLRGKILKAQQLRQTMFTEEALAARLNAALDSIEACA